MLTLKDVRTMVTGNYEGRVLTLKQIQKEEILMKEIIDKSTSVTLYKNGLVLYQVDARYSIFPLPEPGSYLYEGNKCEQVDASFFENENWYIRLILEGEDLLARNQEKLDIRHHLFSHDTDYFKEEDRKDPSLDLLDKLVVQEMCQEILSHMNEKQRFIFIAYYVERWQQKEIAKELQMSQQAVAKCLKKMITEIKEEMEDSNPEILRFRNF